MNYIADNVAFYYYTSVIRLGLLCAFLVGGTEIELLLNYRRSRNCAGEVANGEKLEIMK